MWVRFFFTLLNDTVMPARPFKWRPCLGSYQQSKTAEECKAFYILISVSFMSLTAELYIWFLLVSPSHHSAPWIFFLLPSLLKKKVEEGEIIFVISLSLPFPFPSFLTYSEYASKLLLIIYYSYGEVTPFLFLLFIMCHFKAMESHVHNVSFFKGSLVEWKASLLMGSSALCVKVKWHFFHHSE